MSRETTITCDQCCCYIEAGGKLVVANGQDFCSDDCQEAFFAFGEGSEMDDKGEENDRS